MPRPCSVGSRFGLLHVTAELGRDKQSEMYVECSCDCGTSGLRRQLARLIKAGKAGRQPNCGCAKLGQFPAKHGGAGTSELRSWHSMLSRCCDPTNQAYRWYGGRGITVCERWREDFLAFRADMGPKPTPDHQIDRINSDGNYEPTNCRWVTRTENMSNCRSNRRISYMGLTQTVAEVARLTGVPYDRLRWRLNKGLTPEQAVALPLYGWTSKELPA